MIAFTLFPVGFVLALLSLKYIKEPESDARKGVSLKKTALSTKAP